MNMANEQTPLIPPPSVAADSSAAHHRHLRKREAAGLFCMALSALGFSSMSLFVKLSGASFPSFEIVFARSVIQLVLGLLGCYFLGVHPLGDPKVRPWLVFRGLVGSLGLALFFYSITQLPLADATVIFFLGPMFTAILAAIVLGESFTLFDGICSVFCLFGVVLVSKPEFLFGSGDIVGDDDASWTRIIAILCSLLGAVMSAFAYCTVRKIGRGASYMVHVVYFGGISCVISAIGMYFQGAIMPSGAKEYTTLLLVGITAFIGQCLLNQGLQMAPAGPGTLMRMNDVVFAFLFGIFILHEYPDVYSITGASVHGYDLTLDGLQATIQELSLKEHIGTAYDSAVLYRNYLRNKIEEVTINELEKTNGKRLPILCSTDDYFYYLVHYLPSPMKTYALNRYDERYPSHHRYSTSEERNEQFYLTIKGLPPTIKDKAVAAKDELQSYLSAAPDTGLYDMIDEYTFKWDQYIDSDIKVPLAAARKDLISRLATHRKLLQEYIDQGNVVVELFGNPEPVGQDKHHHHPYETTHHLWMGNTERLSLSVIDQQRAYKQWHHTVELGFLDAVTTLGPLRRLAEEMFDDAMNSTLEALTSLETKQLEGLTGWINLSMDSVDKLDRHLASLPLTTTPAAVDEMRREIDDLFTRCNRFVDQIKVTVDAKKTLSSIDKTWSNARKELTYSRWQWKYWANLWNEEGLNAIIRLFSPIDQ